MLPTRRQSCFANNLLLFVAVNEDNYSPATKKAVNETTTAMQRRNPKGLASSVDYSRLASQDI